MILRLVLLLATLCLTSVDALAADTRTQTVEITVNRRDTLIDLSQKHLATPSDWPRIARLNRLSNPNLIQPGQVIRIPVEMLKGIPSDGIATLVAGEAEIRHASSRFWQPLRLKDVVKEGSLLRTGINGTIEVTTADGTSFLMRPNSLLEVKTSREGEHHLLQRLKLLMGRIISRVKTSTGRIIRHEIHTPSSVAAARGTAFQVSHDTVQVTRSEVLEGVVGMAGSGHEVTVNSGEGTIVRANEPPAPPRRLLPPPPQPAVEGSVRSLPLRLMTPAMEGAAAFRVVVARDQAMRELVAQQEVKQGEAVAFDTLADGTYYLRLSALDADGLEGLPSEAVAFTVRVAPLPPLVTAPAKDAALRRPSVSISWLKVSDAAGYRLQLAEDREFSRILEDRVIGDTSHTTPPVAVGTYFYRILSRGTDGYEAGWSPIQSFTILPPPPTPEVQQPAMDASLIRLRWADLGKGFSYQVQVARDQNFTAIVTDRCVALPELDLPRPAEPGTYHVRIRSIDQEGLPGEFTAPQSFEVADSPPWLFIGSTGAIILMLLVAF